MRYVAGVDSVHTAAAVCDYLANRLTPDDRVVLVAVDETARRDVADAANVVQVRLPTADIGVEQRTGDPGIEILDVATDVQADVVLVGTHRGSPSCGPAVGETTRFILRELDIPVVVVPVPDLDAA